MTAGNVKMHHLRKDLPKTCCFGKYVEMLSWVRYCLNPYIRLARHIFLYEKEPGC